MEGERMSEIRYIRIDSCNRCEHNGHAHDARSTDIIHVCGNPLTSIAIKPRYKISGVDYPITSTTSSIKYAPIPKWCPLPKDA